MLEAIQQTLDQNGKVIFKDNNVVFKNQLNAQSATHDPRNPELIEAVIQGIEQNSVLLRCINFYTEHSAQYMTDIDNRGQPIKLVVNNQEDFDRILNALKTNTHLVELHFSGYNLTDARAQALGDALAVSPSLDTLSLDRLELSKVGAQVLAKGIAKNKQLHSLYLADVTLNDQGIDEFEAVLKDHQSITTLNITNIHDRDDHALFMIPGVARHAREQVIQSLNTFVTRNQKFAKQRILLEEAISAIAAHFKFNKPVVRRESFILSHYRREAIKDNLLTKINASLNNNDEEKKFFELIDVFNELLSILCSQLRDKGYSEWRNLLDYLKRTQAQFYLSMGQIEHFFDLYRNYFKSNIDVQINFEFASRLFACNDAKTLSLLGLHENRLKYQYIMTLISGSEIPGSDQLCKAAYLKLHGLPDAPHHSSLAETIGADRILTNAHLDLLHEVLSAKGSAKTKDFKVFYDAIQTAYEISQTETLDQEKHISILEEQLEKMGSNPNEKFVAQVLLDVLQGKKIALYSQLRQKTSDEPVQFLNLTGTDAKGHPTLNLKEFTNLHFNDRQMDNVETQVFLKYDLAQRLGNGVYEAVFNQPSSSHITSDHSRILSATRLATLPSTFTDAQMARILQIEYAALPDEDKKASASFFTSYRHRTLEKALEDIFVRNRIPRLTQFEVNLHEKQSLAFIILRWIGDQERSFYYKASKRSDLFTTLQQLGNIAHEMIVCNDDKKLAALKKQATDTFADYQTLGNLFVAPTPTAFVCVPKQQDSAFHKNN